MAHLQRRKDGWIRSQLVDLVLLARETKKGRVSHCLIRDVTRSRGMADRNGTPDMVAQRAIEAGNRI